MKNKGAISNFIEKYYLHFNAAALVDAAKGYEEQLNNGAKMLVSLAGCTSMDVTSLLEKMRAQVKDFKVEVEGELTEEHPKYYHTVKLNYIFEGEDLKKDKIEKAVKLSVDRYCGVYEMFRQFSEVSYEIIYK